MILVFFYSGSDASHPEICFLIHSHVSWPPVQEIVGGAGFELETAVSTNGLTPLSHHANPYFIPIIALIIPDKVAA
jgi:hypothetical protein